MAGEPSISTDQPLAAGPGFLLDRIGDVVVVHMDGRLTDASFAAYLQATAREMDGRDPARKVGVVYHVLQPAVMGADRRRALAELLKAREKLLADTTAAYAMATESAIVRATLRILFWLAPPPYPNAVVATPREGFEYLARHMDGLDVDLLCAELERRIDAAANVLAGT